MQLYARWLTKDPAAADPASFFHIAGVAYVDASIHGYSIGWQATPDSEPIIIASPPHHANRWDEQTHREASAYNRAATFVAALGTTGQVIIVSDCLPVTCCMVKGSPSPIIQEAAENNVHISTEANCTFIPLWVPGKELVDLGIDHLSHDAILAMHDVSLQPLFMKQARDLATHHFKSPFTVDLFASTASAQCPRYWTQYLTRMQKGQTD